MSIRTRSLALAALFALALLPALAFANSKQGASKPAPTKAAKTGKTLRLAIPDTSPTVDPALVADDENVQLANLLYSGLVRLDASYHVVPDAARSYKISSDHRTYTFFLRKGMRFSNGDPVTAADFRFSITRSLMPSLKSPSAPTYLLDIAGAHQVLEGKSKSVSGIKVIDALTLQITARWPVPYFLMELTYPTSFALDSKQIMKLGSTDNATWYSNPIGSGPYRLKSWDPNTKMTLVPNAYFYGVHPALKQISISLSAFPSSDVYQYVSRNLDIATLPAYDSTMLNKPGIRETSMLAIDGVYLNLKTKPFASRHVRRALTQALNRNALVTRAMGATVTPFAGYVPAGQPGYDAQLHVLPYDPVAARQELKRGGYADGRSLPQTTLYYADDPAIAKLAASIAKQWRTNLKFNVDIKALTLNTLLAKVESESLSLYLLGWSADYPDPHDWLSGLWKSNAPNNNVRYASKAFDAAVEAADVTWSSPARARLYNKAQGILVNDAVWIPLYIPHRLVYVRPTVANLALTGYGFIPRYGGWAAVHLGTAPTRSRAR